MRGQENTTVVGLVADPGLPATLASRLVSGLPALLARQVSDQVAWRVELVTESVVLDPDGRIDLPSLAKDRKAEHGWDLLVCVTELARRAGTRPIVSDIALQAGAGLVSLPALGAWRLRTRLGYQVLHVCSHLVHDTPDSITSYAAGARQHRLPRPRLDTLLSPMRHVPSNDAGIDVYMGLVGARGRVRLLGGLVRANRPWRLVPHLASATAAAAATAAFGIFYSSIWNMADALAAWRLALITAVAIVAMAVWLIGYNHLWDAPSGHTHPGQAVLYNTATVLTMLIGVSCMYALLFAAALLGSAAVIAAGYLQAKLGHPVGPGDYARLVWLSCSMGIVAGALGSSLEDEQAVRQAAYSRRERQRQARNAETKQQQQQQTSQQDTHR